MDFIWEWTIRYTERKKNLWWTFYSIIDPIFFCFVHHYRIIFFGRKKNEKHSNNWFDLYCLCVCLRGFLYHFRSWFDLQKLTLLSFFLHSLTNSWSIIMIFFCRLIDHLLIFFFVCYITAWPLWLQLIDWITNWKFWPEKKEKYIGLCVYVCEMKWNKLFHFHSYTTNTESLNVT